MNLKRESLDDYIDEQIDKRNENWDKLDNLQNNFTQHKLDYVAHKEDYIEQRQQDQLKVAKVEKELNDYKKVMSMVNVNQEAKQKATGYGVVSLPKNSANGQVSVSMKGNTEVDDEGNTKSVIGATRIKSVGKNLLPKTGWSDGTLNSDSGKKIPSYTNRISSPFIKVKPNATYTLSVDDGYSVTSYFEYDKDKKYIKWKNSATLQLSPETHYVKTILRTVPISDINTNILKEVNVLQLEEGTVATPYEPYKEDISYILAKQDDKIVNLRSLPNGTKDEIRVSGGKAELVKRIGRYILPLNQAYTRVTVPERINVDVYYINFDTKLNDGSSYVEGLIDATGSEYDDASRIGEYYYTSNSNRVYFIFAKGTTLEQAQTALAGTTLIYQLAEPVEVPVEVSGTLLSNPSGTVYVEPVVADAGIYNDGISVLHQDLPIDYVEKLSRVDFTTGLETELDVSKVAVSEDRKSFTHPDLVDGDIVFFTYHYDVESTIGETTIEYYDSRYVLKDDVTGKFYKVLPKVSNGELINELVEV